MTNKVLCTRPLTTNAMATLRERCEVDHYEHDAPMPRAEFLARVRGCDALICMLSDRVDVELFEAAPDLKIVANVAVGYDNVDLELARKRDCAVVNTPGVLTEATADLTWALLLAAARNIVPSDAFVRRGEWQAWQLQGFLGVELRHKTLGVVGFGRIGRAVARRAAGFDMKVVYHDLARPSHQQSTADAANRAASGPVPTGNTQHSGAMPPLALCHKTPNPTDYRRPRYDPGENSGLAPAEEDTHGASWVPLEELLECSDFVTLHTPLVPETHHLIDAAALRRMRKTAVLVNIARGPIVDEAALVEALESGQIRAAGLDVYEKEPRLADRLASLPNVVLAPHLGSATEETRAMMCEMSVEAVFAVFDGRKPSNQVS